MIFCLGDLVRGSTILNLMHFGGKNTDVIPKIRFLQRDFFILLSQIDVFSGFHEYHTEANNRKSPNICQEIKEIVCGFHYLNCFLAKPYNVPFEIIRKCVLYWIRQSFNLCYLKFPICI